MKKFFLDCGTHLGQGLNEIAEIIKVDDTWEVHSWEANPFTFQSIKQDSYPNNYHFYNAAVTVNDLPVSLNVESFGENDCGQGSSIIEKELWMNPMHKGTFNKTVEVSGIDFSAWVKNHCTAEDTVIVKLDIEGAEYNVLEKMILDNTIDLVDHFYIEWHSRFFPNKEDYWKRQTNIIDCLRQKNIQITRWK